MPRRIRIMLVIHDMVSGGAERLMNYIVRHLDPSRFEAHLVLHRVDIAFPLPEGLSVYDLGLTHPLKTLTAIDKLRSLLRSIRPQLLMAGALNPSLLCGEAVRGLADRPVCVSLVVNNPQIEPGWRMPWVRRCYREFDHFIAVCGPLREMVIGVYPFIPAHCVHAWPTPVDVDKARREAGEGSGLPRGKRARMVALGRLCSQKRYDIMFEALRQIRERQDVELVILGEGPLRGRLERYVDRLGLHDAVSMPGFSANPYPVLASADVYLMSSDYEGLPNVLMEAQALGVPVVSTDCPTGPAEIVAEGETGFLVPVGDAAAIACRAGDLLDDSALRERMGQAAGRRMREYFDLDIRMRHFNGILDRILTETPGGKAYRVKTMSE